MAAYHEMPAMQVLQELNSSEKGLSSREAASRLQQYGPNELKEAKKASPLKIFLGQFNNFLVWILLVAVALSAAIGDVVESVIITIIIILNAVIGFVQEYRAEKAIEALKRMSGLKADALRDGERRQIDAKEIVPGDILFLETGDKMPADCRIIDSSNFETQESSLTGESTPVAKTSGPVKAIAVAEQANMAFSGTIATKGRAKAVVVSTGMKTEIGKIATMIQEVKVELTPLQKKLAKFGRQIGIITIFIAGIVFVATVLRGEEPLQMFETAVSLAVAAVPEGLPAVVAMSLAIGVQRMVKKNALIRKLPSVETLGSTTVIATDKTGTLTMDRMTVRKLYVSGRAMEVAGEGYSTKDRLAIPENDKLLLRIGALCNDSALSEKNASGDPTEIALVVSAAKAGMNKEDLERKSRRVDEIPFDSERKRMTTIHASGSQRVMYTKGAPDVILKLCTRIYEKGRTREMTAADRKEIESVNAEFASEALRVLAFAYKPVKGKDKRENALIFVGLQAMMDPPRKEVKAAIEKCRSAGIRVIMITGDHKLTAIAIAKALGIEGKAITGEELDRVKDIDRQVDETGVYARVNPEHKMKIINALKKKKQIAAMTGDGVNDAPALKRADIGISMGVTGTDVAKEASKMVLIDDNFNSIVNAVEEGRGVYENIRKFIYSLLSTNIAEVLIIFLAILLGLKLPLLAIQLLWINLLTDGLPAIALGLEPISKDLMKKKPRNPSDNILDRAMVTRLLINAAVVTIGTLGFYIWALYRQGWAWGQELSSDSSTYIYALTVTFTALVFFEMFTAITAKSPEKNILKIPLLDNKFLLLSVGLSMALILGVVYTPLSTHFYTVALPLADLAAILAVTSLSIFVADALYKFFARKAQQQS